MKKWINRSRPSASSKSFSVVSVKSKQPSDNPPTYKRTDAFDAQKLFVKHLEDPVAISQAAFSAIFSATRQAPTVPRPPSAQHSRNSRLLWPTETENSTGSVTEDAEEVAISEAIVIQAPVLETLPNNHDAAERAPQGILEREEAKISDENWPFETADRNASTDLAIPIPHHEPASNDEAAVRFSDGMGLYEGKANAQSFVVISGSQTTGNDVLPQDMPLIVEDVNTKAQAISAKIVDRRRALEKRARDADTEMNHSQEDVGDTVHAVARTPPDSTEPKKSHDFQSDVAQKAQEAAVAEVTIGQESAIVNSGRRRNDPRRHSIAGSVPSEKSQVLDCSSLVRPVSAPALSVAPKVREIARSMYDLSQTMQVNLSSDLSVSRCVQRGTSPDLKQIQSQMRQISANCVQMQYLASQQLSALSAQLLLANSIHASIKEPSYTVDGISRGTKRRSTMSLGVADMSEVRPLAPLSMRYSPPKYLRSRSSSLIKKDQGVPMQNF